MTKEKSLALAAKRPLGENRAKPESPIVKRAIAANYIADLALGKTMKEVALKYNVSREHVADVLRWAEKENFFAKAEDAIANRLIPKAIDLLEKTLENALRKAIETGGADDWEVAERVLKGVRLLDGGKKGEQLTPFQPQGDDFNEFSYERYIARRGAPASAQGVEGSSADRDGSERIDAIDAEVVLPAVGEAGAPDTPRGGESEAAEAVDAVGGENGQEGEGK